MHENRITISMMFRTATQIPKAKTAEAHVGGNLCHCRNRLAFLSRLCVWNGVV